MLMEPVPKTWQAFFCKYLPKIYVHQFLSLKRYHSIPITPSVMKRIMYQSLLMTMTNNYCCLVFYSNVTNNNPLTSLITKLKDVFLLPPIREVVTRTVVSKKPVQGHNLYSEEPCFTASCNVSHWAITRKGHTPPMPTSKGDNTVDQGITCQCLLTFS